jgi:two-component system, chemotaxis family, response regulator PixG
VDYIYCLEELEKAQFSGKWVLSDPSGRRWNLYFSQGRILYATGGNHPVRRWCRYLKIHCPQRPTYRVAWQRDLVDANTTALGIAWDFALLYLWTQQRKITHEQLTHIIGAIITEVLFDIGQTAEIIHTTVPQAESISPLALIEVSAAISATQQRWRAWQMANLSQYSPNQAPRIRNPAQLRVSTSAESYENLARLLTGQHTLRDLALQMRQETVDVLSSLLPLVQAQWVELISIADLPTPIFRQLRLPEVKTLSQAAPSNALVAHPANSLPSKALVACVDDSSVVRNTMEKLLNAAGYKFLGVEDPVRAISILLRHKPDLIFLDLMMPKVNGDEVCQQLRKLACFRTTPIVILTGNDGYANRLKSNFAGASEFLTKPLDADVVLRVTRKHLAPPVASTERRSQA